MAFSVVAFAAITAGSKWSSFSTGVILPQSRRVTSPAGTLAYVARGAQSVAAVVALSAVATVTGLGSNFDSMPTPLQWIFVCISTSLTACRALPGARGS